VEVEIGGETRVGGLAIRATHAEHGGRRGLFGWKAPAVGYRVSGSAQVYFAGDTDIFEGMSSLSPGLDVALLPVAGWGTRVPAGHLDPLRAAQALTLLRPRIAVPIHWGTYRRIGLPRDAALLREPAESFVRLAGELAPDVDVRFLPIGGRLELEGSAVTEPQARARA
jgi:L-ascorbate metabolism protein UlaG (beta-lactamase superfamily)